MSNQRNAHKVLRQRHFKTMTCSKASTILAHSALNDKSDTLFCHGKPDRTSVDNDGNQVFVTPHNVLPLERLSGKGTVIWDLKRRVSGALEALRGPISFNKRRF